MHIFFVGILYSREFAVESGAASGIIIVGILKRQLVAVGVQVAVGLQVAAGDVSACRITRGISFLIGLAAQSEHTTEYNSKGRKQDTLSGSYDDVCIHIY